MEKKKKVPNILRKSWRIKNLYKIVDKNKKTITFNPNRAQLDFENKRTERNIILKSRQLGFTTYESIDMLDDVLFTPNFSGLLIAHTKDDAMEIFDKKIMLAWDSIVANHTDLSKLWKVDAESANKLKFGFGDNEFSSIIVSNSGRSATNNRVHCSEFAKLCVKFPSKADEVISGTFPSVPLEGRIDIESTAEGMNYAFYEMFMEAWNRKRPALPTEFTAHFYNWTWDDEEIAKITNIIPIEDMDESNKFRAVKELYNYNDIQITYYYSKWLGLKKDWDKLHQEYPNTVEDAFVASGNTFFNKERVVEQIALAPKPISDKDKIPNKLLNYYLNNELKIYELPQDFTGYVIGADVAEGKENDSSSANGINNKTLKPAFSFNSDKIRPDDYAELLNELGLWYNRAYLAVESNSGLWVLTELYEKHKYPNLYWREKIDDITHAVSKQLGYHTGVGAQGRKVMLDNLLVEFNINDGIWTEDFLKECLTFIKNEQGRPEAAEGKHDDEVISTGICHYVRNNAPSELIRPIGAPKTIAEMIQARLEAKKQYNKEISQSDYI
jgi:hypothetical protein